MRPPGAEAADLDITRDVKTFTAAIRHRVFTFLRGMVIADYEQALTHLQSANDPEGQPWTPERLRQLGEAYEAEHGYISLDPNARNVRHTYVTPSEDKLSWRVQQMLVDKEEHNDWVVEFAVNLAESRQAGEPYLSLVRMGTLVR